MHDERYRRYNVYIGMANTFVATHLSTFAAFARSNFQDSLSVLVRPSFRQLLGSRSYSHSPPCGSYLSPRPASRRCSSWRLPPCVSSRLVSSRLVSSHLLFLSLRFTKMRSCLPTTTPSRCTERAERASISFRGVCPSFLFHQRDEAK